MMVEPIIAALVALQAVKAEDNMSANTWCLVTKAIAQLSGALEREGLVVKIEEVDHE